MKLNPNCTCGNFQDGKPFSKDQCAVCWGRNRYRLSLLGKAVNLVTDTANFIASGFRRATKEEQQERLSICETCDRRKGSRCLECGCVIRLAVIAVTKNCPLGKWPTAETQPTSQPASPEPGDQQQ